MGNKIGLKEKYATLEGTLGLNFKYILTSGKHRVTFVLHFSIFISLNQKVKIYKL